MMQGCSVPFGSSGTECVKGMAKSEDHQCIFERNALLSVRKLKAKVFQQDYELSHIQQPRRMIKKENMDCFNLASNRS